MTNQRKYILLDCNFLCHRAKHATGDLKYGEEATGVVYGFLQYLAHLQKTLGSNRLVFCWDSKTSKRRELLPSYKEKRRAAKSELTAEELEFERAFYEQVRYLRIRYLPTIGFKNNFVQPGYEADDIIESICITLSQRRYTGVDRAIIVASDKDLYQCLRPNISIYNPITQSLYTKRNLYAEYGVKPHQWARMKAIAGCPTDNVPGIPGIGEGYALRYLKNELGVKSQKYASIASLEGQQIIEETRPLVKLPFKGVKSFKLQEDELSEKGWRKVCQALGFKSLDKGIPFNDH